MVSIPIRPKTVAQLKRLSSPQQASDGESIPHTMFDTQTYVSGTTTTLVFFNTQQPDPTLGNLEQAGAFTDPQWMELWCWQFDILLDASLSDVNLPTGAGDDIQKLMFVGRPVFTLSISNKNYGQYPLSQMHTTGGAVGFGYGAAAATTGVQVANNSYADGGWNWNGSVVIPPKVGFKVSVQWAAAQTLNNGNTLLRMSNTGVLHRRVL